MKRLYWALLLLFLSIPSAFATENVKDILTPPPGDASLKYLGFIFGTISPTLANSGINGNSQIMGRLFNIFNQVALVVGIILLIYIIIVGTVNSATSGKILGEKWSGTWIPLRSVMGIACLVPTGTGYCLAQIFVMWIVYYGVGAAGTLWSNAIDYLDSGNYMFSSRGLSELHIQNVSAATSSANTVFQGLVCNAWHMKENPKLAYGYGLSADGTQMNFGYLHNDKGIQPDCGAIVLNQPYDKQATAITNLASGLEFYAKEFIKFASDGNHYNEGLDYLTSKIQFIEMYLSTYVDNLQQKDVNYDSTDIDRNEFSSYKNMGWLFAGNYYRSLMSDTRTMNTQPITFPTLNTGAQSPAAGCTNLSQSNDCSASVGDASTGFKTVSDNVISILKQSKGLPSTDGGQVNTAKPLPFWWYIVGVGGDLINIHYILSNFFDVKFGLKDALSSAGLFEGTGDPFRELILVGESLMHAATLLVTSTMIIGGAAFLSLAGLCSAESSTGIAGHTVTSILSTLVLGLAGFAYAQGAMLAIYLPLIPFMIFLVGALGWFMSVIEAMVAAPLVAIGLLWPDAQHEILGRAEPAMVLLLNLFLRPSLMIMGLIAGILICWIGFKLLHIGFSTLIINGTIDIDEPFTPLVIGFIYATTNIAVAKKCFSLIHVVPDKVLSWLGDHSQGHGQPDEVIGAINSGAERGAGNISGASSGVGQFIGYGGADLAQLLKAEKEKKEENKKGMHAGSSPSLTV